MINVGFKGSMIVLCVLAWWAASIVTVDGRYVGTTTDGENCYTNSFDCRSNCGGAGRHCSSQWVRSSDYYGNAQCCIYNPVGMAVGISVALIIIIVVVVLISCYFCPGCPGYERRHAGGVVYAHQPQPYQQPYPGPQPYPGQPQPVIVVA